MNSREALGADGPLAQTISDFSARSSQQDMAACIEQVLADQSILVAESGTGTGKTFAYLVPALLSGRKVLISTAPAICKTSCFTATCRWCAMLSRCR